MKASARRARNKIRGLVGDDGQWKDSKADMEEIILQYFSNLFCTTNPTQAEMEVILNVIQTRLSTQMKAFLDTDFTSDEMMLKLGFSNLWVSRIMRCVSSVAYSFLLNGEVCGLVQPTRGLRQGDPLSPYLFLICAEGLLALIQKSYMDGHFSGFKCSRSAAAITHLFFADNSLLFTRATDTNYMAIKRILEEYAAASGQVVNFSKSALCVSPAVERSECERERLAAIVGIQVVECHEKYLGLPCISGRHKHKMFADIVDKVWGKSAHCEAGLVNFKDTRFFGYENFKSFCKEDSDAILRIPISASHADDVLIWHYDKSGAYSVKSGYWLGCSLHEAAYSSGMGDLVSWWKFLWKAPISSKVKIFIWKACQNWLPTMYNLSCRGIQVTNRCPLCMRDKETTWHALWGCRLLKDICASMLGIRTAKSGNMGKFLEFLLVCFE
ncbi:hypothetical protein Dsin_024985 [Dipteronia sinensis]|uniref:Reverse transcriptase domain-containing protein n=1 Tax=Dipteronia sinensis TaxID=43782 RepID=A0AAD9ZV43_9ROSI|nr:hypothetical protein Dsin_024985 [Dipteronia sinensis]